jgi:hypothetical protein
MEKYSISGTAKTPSIYFDLGVGFLEIKGRSTPENSYEFYQPLQSTLTEYFQRPRPLTKISLNFDYFSTSSSKWLLEFLRKFEKIQEKENLVNVDWHYQDDDILEAGQDYQEMVKLPFNMILSNC